ncbi:hypothetical protein N658DRAFT_508010 [Parathielavia hyrcaniae]|uniref:Tafazzin n=1 Tax=Parathielavia hyrcaniae TaxID=113614 RepID=A0AAN6T074_9PEZI|nr:hypothetical protein N658DRAFT_508010 [Parathielavia hyrcaniae]
MLLACMNRFGPISDVEQGVGILAGDDSSRSRGVNELLADLRRSGLNGPAAPDAIQPTIHPSLRQILQIPETPPPRPRQPPIRGGAAGGRVPAGPPPPRSWLSRPERAEQVLRRSAIESAAPSRYLQRPLPGVILPAPGSLIDVVLRRMVLDWEWQRSYCRYHLYELPTHLRVALIAYLAAYTDESVSVRDLQAVLQPPPDIPEYYEDPALAPSVMNEHFSHLDLSGSIGRVLKLRELSDLLFPPEPESTDLQESWDAADASSTNIPRPLLPNLTHLSLALDPSSSRDVSWRHLLAFAARLPGLTHLSLAFWPEPTLTPNAKLATVVSPQTGRAVQYGGTGPYSHSLDDNWAEQVLVLRRLSRSLYGLEYLDLTGCGAWSPALWASAEEGDTVDWAGAWGKMTALVMYPGYRRGGDGAGLAETARYWEVVDHARRVERHVRSRRAGRGRFFTVETCKRPGEL